MRRITGALVVFVVLAIGAAANATTFLGTDEVRNESQVNGTRASKGVQHLAHHAGLQSMARAQAVRMMERGDIYHNPNLSSDITALGVNWRMVGENVGMGPDEDTIEGALLKSPHHYENIVRTNFNDFGVGVVKGSDGTVYLVQVFAEIAPTAAPAHRKTAPVAAPAVRRAPRTAVAAVRTAVKPRAPAPKPQAKPALVRRPDPNALLGGRVTTADLPSTPKPADGKAQTRSAGLLRKLLDDVAFWS
jgi:hypothetical protein